MPMQSHDCNPGGFQRARYLSLPFKTALHNIPACACCRLQADFERIMTDHRRHCDAMFAYANLNAHVCSLSTRMHIEMRYCHDKSALSALSKLPATGQRSFVAHVATCTDEARLLTSKLIIRSLSIANKFPCFHAHAARLLLCRCR